MDHRDLNRLAATTHIAKHLASTLAPYSIRVNAIAPGLFPTVLAEGLIVRVKVQLDKVRI
jgi:NAD(P)-dependent dehydrogenase (short-subunit alcohol dehydrogenase family)